MSWWLFRTDLEQLIQVHSDEQKANNALGPNLAYLEIPEGIDPGNCKLQNDEGEFSLVDGSADKIGPYWDRLRDERNLRLEETDWRYRRDVQAMMTQEQKDAWDEYCQALRDLPENTEDPEDVSWPEQP